MAILIVDFLEVIDVPDEQRNRRRKALAPLDFLQQALVECGSVGDTGEHVGTGVAPLRGQTPVQFHRLLLEFNDPGAHAFDPGRMRDETGFLVRAEFAHATGHGLQAVGDQGAQRCEIGGGLCLGGNPCNLVQDLAVQGIDGLAALGRAVGRARQEFGHFAEALRDLGEHGRHLATIAGNRVAAVAHEIGHLVQHACQGVVVSCCGKLGIERRGDSGTGIERGQLLEETGHGGHGRRLGDAVCRGVTRGGRSLPGRPRLGRGGVARGGRRGRGRLARQRLRHGLRSAG